MKRIILFIMILAIVSAFGLSDLLRVKNSEAAKLGLPEPNKLLKSSKGFSDPVLMGIRLDKDNPLNIDFIVDCADKSNIDKAESKKLISYFLSALTVSSEDYWVNLSPYEENRIIADSLSKTELGKELLAQDYILKQLSSSLTHPKTQLGKDYWANPVGAQYLDVDSKFNKVWIVPGDIEIYEDGNAAYVTTSNLDLMSEVDYLAGKTNLSDEKKSLDVILPKLREEVNNGKHFSSLRQLYRSMILAVWFKAKFKDSFYRHYINKNKISNLELEDKTVKDRIYKLYCDAFKKGVYSVVKNTDGVKRNYFCGGVSAESINKKITFSSSVNSIDDISSMGPVKTIKTALRAGFAVGENDKVERRKEQPKDIVDIQGVESKANANNNNDRVKEIYNPYAKKEKLNSKDTTFNTMASSVGAEDMELVPLGEGDQANSDQLGAFREIKKDSDLKEVEIDFTGNQVTSVAKSNQPQAYDLNKVLGNAGKIVNYLLGTLQVYNRTRKLDHETLQSAVDTFTHLNQALVLQNSRMSYGVSKAYGVALGASITSFATLVEQVLVKSFALRSFETDKYLLDIREAYSVLESNTKQYIMQNGSIVKTSSSIEGGVDFKEMELKTSSSSIPVEINGIDFENFNGFSFSILAIDSEEDIV